MDQDKEVKALREEKERIQAKIEELSKRKEDEDELREEALSMMQCDDPHKYRKKIVGFAAPFNMTDKDDRIRKDDKSLKYKFKSKEDKALIKKKVNEIKKQREQEKKAQNTEKEKQYQKHRNVMKNLHYKLLREKGQAPHEGSMPAYQVHSGDQLYDITNSQPAIKLNHHQSTKAYVNPMAKKSAKRVQSNFTLETLGQLKYEDIAGGGPDEFNPADIVDEDDSSADDEILKRYRNDELKNMEVNNSISTLPSNAYNQNPHTLRTLPADQVQDQVVSSLKGRQPRRGVHNNSISDPNQILKKSMSKQNIVNRDKSRGKKNLLLNSQDTSPGKRKKGITSDDEKIYKNKLHSNRNKKAELPKKAQKSTRVPNAYESDNQRKGRYAGHVTRSVKKPSSKAPIGNVGVDKSKHS